MFIYKANDTMKMLGHQRPLKLIAFDGIAAKDFGNILEAHRKNGGHTLFEFGVDVFMLGYIYGKRAERSRKNGNKTA